MNRVMDGSLTDDVWVSTLQYGIVNFVTLNNLFRYRKIEDFNLYSKSNFQVSATQEMPYPEYTKEDVAFFISFIAMFMNLSFAIIIPPLIKRIVHEKESGIKVVYLIHRIPC